ncbi:MAG: CDP-glucose 4,6-dehydratase, partial [Pseudomonadota bacterium]
QHALDPLAGYLALAEHLLSGHAMDSAWNFGPDPSGEATVATLADALTAHWPGATVEIAADAHAAPHEAATLRLDSTKARTRLGWRPRWPFDEALTHTAAWYRAWHRGDDLPAFTRAQIEAFAAP